MYYTRVLSHQELREGFDKEKGNRPKLLLTMAVPAGVDTIEAGYDIKSLNRFFKIFKASRRPWI